MRKHFFLMAVLVAGLLAAGPLARAQEPAPAGEFFFGYSYMRTSSTYIDTNGWGGSLEGNINRFLGVEMSLVKFPDVSPPAPAFGDYFRALFGPHFAYNGNSRLSPFGHVLLGVTRGRQCPPQSPCQSTSDEVASNAFTQAIGGGLDVKAYRFLWVRAIQADYVRVPFSHATENNLQLSFGVVLRWGRVP